MLTSLDLLVVVAMALAASSLLTVVMMYVLPNKTAKRVFFYIVAALAVYMGYVGFRINIYAFLIQVVLAVVLALTAIGAVVLERVGKNNKKLFLVARIMASVALVAGMFNAFL